MRIHIPILFFGQVGQYVGFISENDSKCWADVKVFQDSTIVIKYRCFGTEAWFIRTHWLKEVTLAATFVPRHDVEVVSSPCVLEVMNDSCYQDSENLEIREPTLWFLKCNINLSSESIHKSSSRFCFSPRNPNGTKYNGRIVSHQLHEDCCDMDFCFCYILFPSPPRTCPAVSDGSVTQYFSRSAFTHKTTHQHLLWTCEWSRIDSVNRSPCTSILVRLKQRSERKHQKTSCRVPIMQIKMAKAVSQKIEVKRETDLQNVCDFRWNLNNSCGT